MCFIWSKVLPTFLGSYILADITAERNWTNWIWGNFFRCVSSRSSVTCHCFLGATDGYWCSPQRTRLASFALATASALCLGSRASNQPIINRFASECGHCAALSSHNTNWSFENQLIRDLLRRRAQCPLSHQGVQLTNRKQLSFLDPNQTLTIILLVWL